MLTKIACFTLIGHTCINTQLRDLSLSVDLKKEAILSDCVNTETSLTKDGEWLEAQPYDTLPGPSRLHLIRQILPGDNYLNVNSMEMHRHLRLKYGDIYRIRGIFGKKTVVCTYNPNDFQIIFRNEGLWSVRVGFHTLRYHRHKIRTDIFQGLAGLAPEQGKSWYEMRSKVNPVLMKVQNVRQNLQQVDLIAQDFVKRIEASLKNNECIDLYKELKKWSFESISYIALNRRMGLLTNNLDLQALQLVDNMEKFFYYSYVYDIRPSIWPYYQTPGFKRYLKILDHITDICLGYIEEAKHKIKMNNGEDKSVLGKLLEIDEKVALVMVLDMFIAGIDTTSSVITNLYYQLATNPDKQSRLREEILEKLPTLNSSLTIENTQNFPYLRACFKEALRLIPATPWNLRRTTKDLILPGYRIPAGTDVLMGIMELSNCDKYFPSSGKFIPERWLKNEAASAVKSKNIFAYAPFGFGPRTCIGKCMAELEVETLTARLLRHFRISWEGNEPIKYAINVLTMPHGEMRFKFEKITQ